ncbi:uncharacterized protein VTP21DRAFT_5288 [Calcarisporiella thermophila]|uniref:uncharacterized protein n=1 Tax=Calcarisporiella thermophila TaxID=911321 RepID=UPI0037439A0A
MALSTLQSLKHPLVKARSQLPWRAGFVHETFTSNRFFSSLNRRLNTHVIGRSWTHRPTWAFATTRSYSSPATTTFTTPVDASTASKIASLSDNTSQTLETVSSSPSILDGYLTSRIADTTMHIGDLKSMGLCHNTPVGWLQSLLEATHVWTGLPWWGTIALVTVAIRSALMPFMISIQRNNANMMNINPEMQRLMSNIQTAKNEGDSAALSRYTMEVQDLFRKNKCHPLKSLGLPLLQAPVMISFYLALRKMSELPVPQFQEGGIAWFTDLTAKDPYYILPAVSCMSMMAILELGTEAGASTPQTRQMKTLFRGLAIVMIPATCWFPSSVFCYWITSNLFSMGQIAILRNKTVRRFLNIPEINPRVQEENKKKMGFMEAFKAITEDARKKAVDQERQRQLRERQAATALRRQSRKRF